MEQLPVIIDAVTLFVLVVLYFAYDRHAVPAPRREDVERDSRPAARSRGRVLPFRPRHVL